MGRPSRAGRCTRGSKLAIPGGRTDSAAPVNNAPRDAFDQCSATTGSPELDVPLELADGGREGAGRAGGIECEVSVEFEGANVADSCEMDWNEALSESREASNASARLFILRIVSLASISSW